MGDLSIQQLVEKMERNDRRFRIAQSLFMFLIGAALVMLFVLQLNQNAQRAKLITDLERHNDSQLQLQTKYIQCIFKFFANQDRQNKTVADPNTCAIQDNGEPIPGVDITPSKSPSSTFLSNPRSTGANANEIQGSQPSFAQPPANETPPAATKPEQSDKPLLQAGPLTISGTPVCLPWAGICTPKPSVILGL